jgi:hypothetical protein
MLSASEARDWAAAKSSSSNREAASRSFASIWLASIFSDQAALLFNSLVQAFEMLPTAARFKEERESLLWFGSAGLGYQFFSRVTIGDHLFDETELFIETSQVLLLINRT